MSSTDIIFLTASLGSTVLFVGAVTLRFLTGAMAAKLRFAARLSRISSSRALWVGGAAIAAIAIESGMACVWPVVKQHSLGLEFTLFSVVELALAVASLVNVGVDADARDLLLASTRPWLATRARYMRRQLGRYRVVMQSEGSREFSLHLRRAGAGHFFDRRLPTGINNIDVAAGALALAGPSLLRGGMRSVRIASPHVGERTMANQGKTATRVAAHFPGWRYEDLPVRPGSTALSAIVHLTQSDWSSARSVRERVALVIVAYRDSQCRPAEFRGFRLYR